MFAIAQHHSAHQFLHFGAPPWQDPNSVGSVWAGRFFHCSSRSCCMVPGAALQDSKLLHQSGVPSAVDQEAQICEFSPQGIHLVENSRYCHWIAHQRLKHGPRFRKWKCDCRQIECTPQLQKKQLLLHSNTALSEQYLRNPLCAPALANNCCNQLFPILSKARNVIQREKLLTQQKSFLHFAGPLS